MNTNPAPFKAPVIHYHLKWCRILSINYKISAFQHFQRGLLLLSGNMSFRVFKIFLSGVLLPLEAGWCSHLVASVKHTWRKKLLATYRCDRWYYQRHNKHKKTNHFTGIAWSCFLLRTCLDNVHADKSLFHICFFYLPVSFSPWCLFIPKKAIDVPMFSVAICFMFKLWLFLFSQRASRRCEKVDVYSPPLEARATEPTLLRSVRGNDREWNTTYKLCVASVEDIYDT